ncbi:hypothetical protein VTN00DRAFT_4873 [Thermoascus crustaceus]|uniref:uncharacterized protein n=1 Tax=Thermoascus crustaceus TaxID=5088 RepID=UPI003743E964
MASPARAPLRDTAPHKGVIQRQTLTRKPSTTSKTDAAPAVRGSETAELFAGETESQNNHCCSLESLESQSMDAVSETLGERALEREWKRHNGWVRCSAKALGSPAAPRPGCRCALICRHALSFDLLDADTVQLTRHLVQHSGCHDPSVVIVMIRGSHGKSLAWFLPALTLPFLLFPLQGIILFLLQLSSVFSAH